MVSRFPARFLSGFSRGRETAAKEKILDAVSNKFPRGNRKLPRSGSAVADSLVP